MRKEEDFLGRTAEMGQAFNSFLHIGQCCYACQGMMEYLIPARFKPKDVKRYLVSFDWVRRAGYAHACAEIAVSQQCAAKHLSEGQSSKH
jgi:hypothetical protein